MREYVIENSIILSYNEIMKQSFLRRCRLSLLQQSAAVQISLRKIRYSIWGIGMNNALINDCQLLRLMRS